MSVHQSGRWVPPVTVHPIQLHIPVPAGFNANPGAFPSLATRTPGELLKDYYSDRENVRDWTNPDGILRMQQQIHREHPGNAVKPIGSSGLIGRWPRPDGLRAVPVPLDEAGSFSDRPEFGIDFTNSNPQHLSTGTSVLDIHQGAVGVMEGANDVLNIFRGKDIRFLISWPGYPPEMFTFHTRRARDGALVTRFELAQQVTVAYANYFKKIEDMCLLPKKLGFFNIALHQGQNAKEDSLGIQILQLHLVNLRITIEGHWVATIDIL